ncbi:Homoserine/homoserine lactone efflux protein [Aliiroseovarius pelagivivens]|uniref:Homoserine/homoserine lactone efflux protein n=1 Tax=Aliiroseovarius pelagivivens TaxID=1639690 RepID=A0A2R8AIG3_9RHOB|nr:LysE family translocator [Aliiroseovarius pelagivivens]SPF75664.1 Homoserine/homoserine lactone efflux protein [Aliiroseovarius pelagivivens]
MTLATLALFIPACFALNIAPGPNNVLAFSNAARRGLLVGLAGGMGRMLPFAAMILLVGIGLGAVLAASETAFNAVKYAGAAYLVYVGWRMWRAKPQAEIYARSDEPVTTLIRRDFLIAIGNPKAIAIFTAFFPQFTDLTQPLAPQYALLGGLFLVLECLAVALYAGFGAGFQGLLTPNRLHNLNKGVGGFLIFSGLALALNERH